MAALAAGKQAAVSWGDRPFLCRGTTEMWMRSYLGIPASMAASANMVRHHFVSEARRPQLFCLRSWFKVVGRRPVTSRYQFSTATGCCHFSFLSEACSFVGQSASFCLFSDCFDVGNGGERNAERSHDSAETLLVW